MAFDDTADNSIDEEGAKQLQSAFLLANLTNPPS
jgi:hypothetical protein